MTVLKKAQGRRTAVTNQRVWRSPLLRKTGLMFELPETYQPPKPTWSGQVLKCARELVSR
ncbi:hypothetical protein LCGC14_0693680 [marine sediment metagenome]|uniref:Uncharacterized protein n=1 Tax=marine sediment metagenome TaxID=412755 RepID=A0A0F9R518_9ZZZZ